ncbi:MAG TPA: acetamidase/formamidase family protein [Planctomycetota bacterium]|nr:acetamidase/formamidase family protein [Planctomycetota bacterium]
MTRTHRLIPKKYYFTYGVAEAAVVIRPGDRVVTTTRDAGGGDEKCRPIPESMKELHGGRAFQANPLTGPIVVDGAKEDDTLVVHIRDIKLTRPTAYSSHSPGAGAFSSGAPGLNCRPHTAQPARDWLWKLDRKNMTGTLALKNSKLKKATIGLAPFIGSIGVAPRFARVEMSVTPGEYGGNMDNIETKKGTTLYLPVNVDGAYLYLGDVHAAQGDGEICGVALEVSAEVTLTIDVVKGRHLLWPRMEDRTHIMTSCSMKPLMDAMTLAHVELIGWLVRDYGFDRDEAYQLVSQASTTRIGNVVDPAYTVVAKFPKKHLPT